jgi:hypothetical protein
MKGDDYLDGLYVNGKMVLEGRDIKLQSVSLWTIIIPSDSSLIHSFLYKVFFILKNIICHATTLKKCISAVSLSSFVSSFVTVIYTT